MRTSGDASADNVSPEVRFCRKCGATKRLNAGRWTCPPCKSTYDQDRREDPAMAALDRERSLAWAASHRDVASARARAWHKANALQAKARKSVKYIANIEAEREKRRQDYRKNKAAYIARATARDLAYPEQRAVRAQVRRQKIRSNTTEERRLAAERRRELSGQPCVYCAAPFEEIDHIVPIAEGGREVAENLQPICGPCNRRKWAHSDAFMRDYVSRETST